MRDGRRRLRAVPPVGRAGRCHTRRARRVAREARRPRLLRSLPRRVLRGLTGVLEELHVRDLALIEDVRLEFGPGMTVLTGETGAGKTALVGALTLLLGERADSSMVRAGAAEALVEGRFAVGGEEVLARRRVTAEGRSRCDLGDGMATVGALEAALGPLVDLHGQHEHQALLRPARHTEYLDRFAGAPVREALDAYAGAWASRTAAAAGRDAVAAALGDRERRVSELEAVVREIDAVAPHEGEDEEIEARLPALRHAERLAEAAALAIESLRGEAGAGEALDAARGALGRAAGLDPALDALAEALGAAADAVEEAARGLRAYGEGVSADPRELDAAETRLAALRDLARRHGPTLGEVLAERARAAGELAALEKGEEGLADAEAALALADAALKGAGESLAAARAAAAPAFEAALAAAARDLAMEAAAFRVAFEELPYEQWSAEGPQRVEFLFSVSAGEPPRPLAKIASGGEVSRVMLALKGVLGAADDVPVLVFDEVDAGIGGTTAHAVGRRLAALARGHQVLVVTHLAQVAVHAGAHVVVEKVERDGRTVTSVRTVTGDERVAEVARMLSGGDSDAVLAHARELLEAARGEDVGGEAA
ncbi:MAG: DNA repair protein RecN [Actinobacteria bacterium]|nr:MAG: DNA repair protein RecN [Actinomycetota bacterium]